MAQPRRAITARNGEEVSPLDRKIIEHLQEDGRRPFTQIATELGVSEAAIRARTSRLIEKGILKIVGVTDPQKIGFDQMATIAVHCERASLVTAAVRIAAFPEVASVVIVAGAFDLLVEAVCEDSDALLDFLNEKLGHVEGIRDTEAFTYLRVIKHSHEWIAP